MDRVTPQKAMRRLREIADNRPAGRTRVYAPGCAGEASIFVDALRSDPSLAAELTFLGIWIPGVNTVDYAGLHPDAKAEAIFMAPHLRESFTHGDIAIRPLSYTQAYPWLETTPLDAALFQVTPPGPDGLVTLGVSADFSPAVWTREDVFKIAHVNRAMPKPLNTPSISIENFDIIVDDETPILAYTPSPVSPVFHAIADHIASLISDGDTLQFGLGNVQLAVLKALSGRKNLRIHSGMISDPVLDAVQAGAIDDKEGAITTGVALGSTGLYDFCSRDPRLRFAPVCETHALKTLASLNNFTAINSVIEVDLFGQANAEYFGQRQVSGAGGLVDFLRGAAAAPNGKPIVALASTAKNGAISRVVPKLSPPSISITRADMGFVVTEHGIADLRDKTVDERATALIAIADPRHRDILKNAWRVMKDDL